jgi:hypothetical protein
MFYTSRTRHRLETARPLSAQAPERDSATLSILIGFLAAVAVGVFG